MDSLEKEYKRDEDWCSAGSGGDKMGQLISKHQEQKEAFLKACTHARRTAETFLKYANRSLQYNNYPSDNTCESTVKGEKSLFTSLSRSIYYTTSLSKSLARVRTTFTAYLTLYKINNKV